MNEETVFKLFDPGRLVDTDLELVLVRKFPGDLRKRFVPEYEFEMRRAGKDSKIGFIALRVGNTDELVLYRGHVGYDVESEYRGNRYAARSCRLILALAKHHKLNPLWITSDPDNIASRRTCEIIGAEYVETVEIPEHSEMYKRGDRLKCRYRLDL